MRFGDIRSNSVDPIPWSQLTSEVGRFSRDQVWIVGKDELRVLLNISRSIQARELVHISFESWRPWLRSQYRQFAVRYP